MALEQNTVHVRLHGPTVQGFAEPIVERMMIDSVAEVADYTKHEVLMRLDAVLQHPTGYYESQVRADMVDPYTWSVNDGNVIYGPWLEGTGSRNATTRFKGYHTFRITQGRMSQKSKAVVEAHLARMIGGL